MARTLATLTPRGTLAPADPRTDTLIRAFTNRLEDGPDWRRRALPARLAPTDGEREVMAARVSDIDHWLSPSRRAAIVRAVELMRANLVIANGASDDAIEGYIVVLTPFPEPVIESICRRYMDGRLGNRTYAPMPAEIAHECRLAVADALAERGRIMLVLDAEVYDSPSEEDQAKIAERYTAFVAETASRARMPPKPAPEPLRPDRDPNLTAELESRRIRRETREAEQADADPSFSHEETESVS